MRTIDAGLLAHYQSGQTTLAWAIKITRTDAEVFGWTSHQRDVTISAVLYRAGPGLDVAALATTAGLGVDNSEMTVLPDDSTVTIGDILAGKWDGAAYELFRFDWTQAAPVRDVLQAGTLGPLQPRRGAYVVELRGLQQYLQQPIGSVSSKTCRARLGDALCTVDLAPFTVTGTLTGVTSNSQFTDTARAEADDYFAEGLLTFTSGNNDGLSYKVKTYAADVFTLSVAPIGAVQVGDTYSVIAGCRKRLDEDCVAKFSNAVNFQGEPHRPTLDSLTAPPIPNAE
jgi:uncharacterized phage protein (TIGR02218 family)